MISLFLKRLDFVPTCNNIDKAKLKIEPEVSGKMLCLNSIFVKKIGYSSGYV